MKNFYVITNISKDPEYQLAKEVCQYLNSLGCQGTYQEVLMDTDGRHERYNTANPSRIPIGTECVIVLGGDGTLIQAARDLSALRLPVFGVNIGHIGYLTEIDKDQMLPALKQIVAGQYEIDERMLLSGSVIREGEAIFTDIALNDIVINRMGPLQMIHFDVYVNKEFLITYPADGLIVATPTGSTAYNLSAGGPIVQPRSNMIITTPICAHVLNKSSVIFDGKDELELVMKPVNGDREERAVTFDGAKYCMLQSGDVIRIKTADLTAQFLHTKSQNFLQILRNKLS